MASNQLNRIIPEKDMQLYQYYLPSELIAQKPITPRDFSRLFVYIIDQDKIFFDRFYNLSKYLDKNHFLVLNNTQVLPAKVKMKKDTGGQIEILFLINEIIRKPRKKIRGLVNRHLKVKQKVYFPDSRYFLKVVSQKDNIFIFQFDFSFSTFLKLINLYGQAPLPPYIKKTNISTRLIKNKYQTIFAKQKGSVAAPTASLHFTRRVFQKLQAKKIKWFFATLHIGLGTFAPLKPENIFQKKLHPEYWEVNFTTYQQIIKLKKNGKKLIAVGTTTTRLLETLARKKIKLQEQKISGITQLFICPPFEFKFVDGLITNFHLPQTSLMMLVEAFLQFKKSKRHLKELYQVAIQNNFRFYSFGDAMLLI